MKRAVAWIAVLVVVFVPLHSQTREKIRFLPDEEKYLTVALGGGLFFSKDDVFRQIYGDNLPVFGPQITFRFPILDPHGLDFLLGGRLLRAKGKTSYTREETSLRINSLSFSVRYSLETGRFALFLGPGMDYVMYKEAYAETFPVDSVEGNEAGFHVTTGGYYHLSSALSLQGYFKYCLARTDAPGFRVDLGGSEWGVAIVYRFYL